MLWGLVQSLFKRNLQKKKRKSKSCFLFPAAWDVDAMAGTLAAILTYDVTLGREPQTQMMEQIK